MNKKLLSITILLGGFSAISFAQSSSATAAATVSGTVVAPITLLKQSDLNFGSFTSGTTAGTVVYNPATTARSATSGVTLASPSFATLGSFAVGGQSGTSYTVTTTAAPITLTHTNLTSTITLTSITLYSSNATTPYLLTGSNDALIVGGTLTVPISSTAGVYTSAVGALSVTVNYL